MMIQTTKNPKYYIVNTICFLIGLLLGLLWALYQDINTDINIPVQHELWIDKNCNVRINRGVRVEQKECLKKLEEKRKNEI